MPPRTKDCILVKLLACPPKTLGRRRSSAAFTLVELLVVIAILAVLAALLLPAAERALQAGRAAVCRGNLRQIGQAMVAHTQDFGNCLPFHGDPTTYGRPSGGGTTDFGAQWDIQLMPYIGIDWVWGSSIPPSTAGTRPTVFYCPASRPWSVPVRSLSFNYNQRVGQNRNGSRNITLLVDPVSTLLVIDAVPFSGSRVVAAGNGCFATSARP